MLKNSLLYLLIVFSIGLFSQNNLEFSRVGISEGLSNSMVYDIIQDSRGYIWIATANGLNRYDGYNINIYQNDPLDSTTIGNNKISSLAEDANGNIWIGTLGSGLYCYYYNDDRFVSYHKNNDYRNIFDIKIDKNGLLWCATSRGAFNYDISKNKYNVFDFSYLGSDNSTLYYNIQKIVVTKDDNVYLASNGGGVFEYDKKSNDFTQYIDTTLSLNYNYRLSFSIFEDNDGEIWVGTFLGGLYHFNKQTKSFTFYQNPYYKLESYKCGVISINQLNKSQLLLGLNGGGLAIFDKNKRQFVKLYTYSEKNQHSLSDNYIPIIYKDQKGVFWIGTENGGCSVYNPFEKKFKPIRPNLTQNSLSDKIVNSFYQKDSLLWICTEGGYINSYNLNTKQFNNYKVPNYRATNQGHWIRSIVPFNKEEFLVGSQMGGFSIFNAKTEKFKRTNLSIDINHDCITLHKEKDGTIWAGTYRGLYKYKNGEVKSLLHSNQIGIVNQPLEAICVIGDEVWVGYMGGGIHVLNKKSNNFVKNYSHNSEDLNSLSNNFVTTILNDTKGRIWVGTQNGLNLYNKKSKKFKKFFSRNGLSNNEIYGILEDNKGNLWISTAYGLNEFNPENETFRVYFESDGLQSNQFRPNAYYQNSDGIMFFGGINGFNYFHPDSISSNDENGKLVFTDFQIFNKSVIPSPEGPLKKSIETTRSLTLSHKEYLFSFEFALLNYSLPEKNTYRYKLEGFHDEWNNIGNRRFISFTSLPAGNYILQIQGANSDGVWSSNQLTLELIITPPFYKTWWFYVLVIIIVLLITFLIFKIRLRAINNQKKNLETQVKARTAEINEQKNLIQLKNNEILDSIKYAKRIQSAILPSKNTINQYLPNSFIIYKPKDIVAGDFYWIEKKDDVLLFAVADCTGHGVPGAMVSVICNNGLNRCVREYGLLEPGKILDKTRELVVKEFEKSEEVVQDGMDIALCSVNKNILSYSGANNPLWIIRKGELIEIKANKQPIGVYDDFSAFTTHQIDLKKDDNIYIFSDGFVDQFGGPKNKKFKAKQLKDILIANANLPIDNQNQILLNTFDKWKGANEQIDDVCMIGVKIT